MENKYPINTLEQVAAIPEEAMPRFLAELPSILAEIRRMSAMKEQLAGIADLTLAGFNWLDDGAQDVYVNVEVKVEGANDDEEDRGNNNLN